MFQGRDKIQSNDQNDLTVAALIEKFFRENGKLLLGYAINKVGDVHEAQDLVQETALQALKRSATFDPRRGSLKTWIFVILDSLAIDWHRSREKRKLSRVVGVEDDGGAWSVGLAAEMGSRLELESVLARLSNEHREVVKLVVLDGRTSVEAASMLGILPGTARSRLFYALGQLRSELAARSGLFG